MRGISGCIMQMRRRSTIEWVCMDKYAAHEEKDVEEAGLNQKKRNTFDPNVSTTTSQRTTKSVEPEW